MNDLFELESWRLAGTEAVRAFVLWARNFAPRLFVALLVLTIGWGLSRLCQALSTRILERLGLDRLVARLGLTATITGILGNRTLSRALGRFLFWIMVVAFVLIAADAVGLQSVTAATTIVVQYLPRVIGAVVIIVVTVIFGRFCQRLVESGAALGSIEQAPRVGAFTNVLIIVTGSILAMEQLGVSTEILVAVATAIVATLGLAMGGAFALGARGVVAHVLAGHFLRQRLPRGEDIEVDGVRGTVEDVGAVDTTIRVGDARLSVPNAKLLDQTVKR